MLGLSRGLLRLWRWQSGALKGQCHEIFDFWFFQESVSLKPKFAEIFAAQGAPPVSLTPMANGKNLQTEKFKFFCLDTFG
jgi:hypothetical protein